MYNIQYLYTYYTPLDNSYTCKAILLYIYILVSNFCGLFLPSIKKCIINTKFIILYGFRYFGDGSGL